MLAQALSNREEINCTISFYRTSISGFEEKFFTVEIEGGIIADLTLDMPHVVIQNDAEPQEHVGIRYREITWRHHLASTSGYASWGNDE